MPYYPDQGRQGYDRSTSPRRSRRYPPSPPSESSSSESSRSPSRSRGPRSAATRSTAKNKKSEQHDTFAKAGIVIGAIAVFAGVQHLMNKHRAEQQAALQRERRVEAARRERRRRKEEEEDRRAEEEERRRDEYDDWKDRGRRGMYIEAPQEPSNASREKESKRAR